MDELHNEEVLKKILRYPEQYEKYVDALMLIHDLLSEFSPTQDPPRFTRKEVEERFEKLLDPETLDSSVFKNLRRNYSYAIALRDEIEKIIEEYHNVSPEIELKATLFLEALLQTYTKIRIMKREANTLSAKG